MHYLQRPTQIVNEATTPVLCAYDALWRGILLSASLLVLMISIYNVLGRPKVNPDWAWSISLTSIAWLVVFLIATYRQFRNIYLFTSAYVLIFFIFHLSFSIATMFGGFENPVWFVEIDPAWVERAGWYSILSLGCLGIGFTLSLRRPALAAGRNSQAGENSDKVPALSFAYWCGIGLFVASLVFFAIAILTFGNLLNYSRLDFFQGVDDTRGVGAFLMVFPSSLLLLVIGAQTRSQKYLAYMIFAAGFTLLLFSGYRSMALFPLVAGMVIWVKIGRKIPVWVAASIFVAAVVAISAIGMLRAMGTYGDINLDSINQSIKKANVEDAVELGGTALVLSNILKLVPEEGYWWGMTYIREIRHAFPRVIPGKSDAPKVSLNDPEGARMLGPGRWITYKLAPWKFRGGEGLGFSAVGEPYMNFGLPGVMAFFTLLGFVLGRMETLTLLSRPKSLVFIGIAFWPLLKSVRNDFGVFTKPVVFALIIVLIWNLATRPFVRSRGN